MEIRFQPSFCIHAVLKLTARARSVSGLAADEVFCSVNHNHYLCKNTHEMRFNACWEHFPTHTHLLSRMLQLFYLIIITDALTYRWSLFYLKLLGNLLQFLIFL